MKRILLLLVLGLLTGAAPRGYAQIPDLAEAGDTFGEVLAQGDFNGDGFADLAVGLRQETVGEIDEAGAVNVLYGSRTGLTTDGAQVWHQDVEGIRETAEVNDGFGVALAAGDFDGDGFGDLAIGIHEEDIPVPFVTTGSQIIDAGAVQVLYGSPAGLTAARNQFWTEDSAGLPVSAQEGDTFGEALTAGDFDGDGFDDLAIGAPRVDFEDRNSGIVHVLYGSADSLGTARSDLLNQDDRFGGGAATRDDHFGIGLTSGDFNCDGRDDVVVSELEEIGAASLAGAVTVFYGIVGGFGVSAEGEVWHQDSPNIENRAEPLDLFGRTLAAGDFDGNGCDDLAVGVRESFPDIDNGGAVHVLYGEASGLTAKDSQFWFQDAVDVEGTMESLESFGHGLATADFNADGFVDLAVGVVGENLKLTSNAGAVQVFFGSENGLTAADDEIWHQDVDGVVGEATQADVFGRALTAGDFDKDGLPDLAIGIPGDDIGDLRSTGAVLMLRGDKAGFTVQGNQLYRQATALAVSDSAPSPEDTPVVVDVLSNDLQVEGGALALARVSQPGSGVAETTASGTIRYLPAQDVTGPIQFTYTVRHPDTGDESTAVVTIDLLPVNDAPVFLDGDPFAAPALSGQPYETTVAADDIDGDVLTFSAPLLPSWLSLTQTGTHQASLSGTPTADDVGDHLITLRIADGFVERDRNFTLTVVLGDPFIPLLLEPADRATGVALPPTLVWQAVDGAAVYDIEIATVGDFSATVLDTVGVVGTALTITGLRPSTTYFWRVQAVNDAAGSGFSPAFFFSTALSVATEEAAAVPSRFELHANYPNPFNPTTTIAYALPQAAEVRLVVYDLFGRAVATLVEARQAAGRYAISFDASGLASGPYFYRVEAGSFIATRRMLLVK